MNAVYEMVFIEWEWIMRLIACVLCCASAVAALTGASDARSRPNTGPWDLASLQKAPEFTVADRDGNLASIYYTGEPYHGKPTRVFAYLAYPEKIDGRAPAMVLVHGGGGKAFAAWAKMWADRGYVALAMDCRGNGPDGQHLPDGGPEQTDESVFFQNQVRDFWTYHAVASVIRGVSLLSSLPEVDPNRIGITGISWGGFLTCIVAGLDQRLKVAVPVYGCGFIYQPSAWSDLFTSPGAPGKLTADQNKLWIANYDPSLYVGQAGMPVLFVNGTNDFAYWMDIYQKTYRLVKNRTIRITTDLNHSHEDGWAPVEIGLFVDQHLRGGAPLAAIRTGTCHGSDVNGTFTSRRPIVKASLHFTTDLTAKSWERKWTSVDAAIDGSTIKARLPDARPVMYFLTITDDRGATVSTEHEIVVK